MAGLIVRRVNACDRAIASEVNRLQRLTLPSDSPCTLAGAMWWLVYDDSQPVAFAGLRRSAQFCDAGYLCRAGVAASHRGQGLQRRLIQVRENQARKSGWKWLLTDTYCNPPSAIASASRSQSCIQGHGDPSSRSSIWCHGFSFTMRLVWVFVPASSARTIGAEKRIGRSVMASRSISVSFELEHHECLAHLCRDFVP